MESKDLTRGDTMSSSIPHKWPYRDHPVTRAFAQRVAEMVEDLDRRGRGQDLDKIARYTRQPRGAVSRLTAVFWTIDEEYQGPVREMVEAFRQRAAAEFGRAPDDEVIYGVMYGVYLEKRGGTAP